MAKPATAAELRKLLIQVLGQFEQHACSHLALLEVLKEHGIPVDQKLDERAHSSHIRAVVHRKFAPLVHTIESEDDEALRQELQRMPTGPWMN